MGVKTKVFGKFAWLVFEGIGRFYDEYMLKETNQQLRQDMRDFMRECFFLIGFILPCIYCRVSYREFTDPAHPANQKTDIYKMLSLKDGAKQLVYHLHNRVNQKLRDQEREQYEEDREKLKEINEKWKNYAISYEDAIKTRFPAVTSLRFWNALIVFLALVLCDFRPEESCYIYRFFWVIGKMFSRAHEPEEKVLACAYVHGLEQTLPIWNRDMKLSTRLDIVWTIKKYVFAIHNWPFDSTRASFEEKCKSAIVGCNVAKPVPFS
jgi:hypothetical protein